MKKRLIFVLAATLLLMPWPVAYAYDAEMGNSGPVNIEPADPAAAPKLDVFGNAIGSVAPGDLFLIDSSTSAADTVFTLYLTNTDELVHQYRYLTLNISTYVQTAGDDWEKVRAADSDNPPEYYLTLQNGMVSFTLPGYGRYKIAIDKGSFYAYGTGSQQAVSPKFYLTTG